MSSGTITLNKSYFETLLRRAQFHTPGADLSTPLDVQTVTIPKSDHDSLLSSARQYGKLDPDLIAANLRRNLYRGGIAEDTLSVLIKDDPVPNETNGDVAVQSTMDGLSNGGALLSQVPSYAGNGGGGQDYTFGRNANYTPRNGNGDGAYRSRETNGFHSQSADEYSVMPDGADAFWDATSGNNDSQPKYQRQQYEKFCKRTVLLANLPEAATHSDVTDVVRGGMLLDVYIRTQDRTASVSFLEESAAQEFFRHVKRHDLYIRGKRVEIRWSDRQFILPGHVANKISIGATRNLVIQGRTTKHTEEAIKDDLEHIHNLVVIRITFSGQNAYISTNSVHNAMFARTCMMSRAVYKGSKIEWDIDECATPLEKPQQTRREQAKPTKKDAPPMNRFHLLNIDGTEDGSEDDDHESSAVTFPTHTSPTSIRA